jgi:ADP-ribose pyrophosphatase YjhB (NUDIX family)
MSNSEQHFVGQVAQKAIIVRGDKVLITRDSRDENTWEIPGGRLNVGETAKDGLKRALFEELGVHGEVHEVVHVDMFHHKRSGIDALVLVYKVTISEEAAFVVDPLEVAEMKWVDRDSYQQYRLFPAYERALHAYFKKEL